MCLIIKKPRGLERGKLCMEHYKGRGYRLWEVPNYDHDYGKPGDDDYSQLGASRLVGYNHLIPNKRQWNNC